MNITDNFVKSNDILWAEHVAEILKKHNYSEMYSKAQNEIASLRSKKIHIAILGLHKRGKSTLCNVLLGRQDDTLAPVNKLPTTNLISKFVHDTHKSFAEVLFLSGETQKIDYGRIKEFATEQFNPGNIKHVDSIIVYGDFNLDHDAVLIDLPGEDSIHAYHATIINKYLPVCDVILFLSCAHDPIRSIELELLKRINDDILTKIFFIINKKDLVEKDELHDAITHNENILRSKNILIANNIHCISAGDAYSGKVETSGIPELLEDIKNFLRNNKHTLFRESFYRNILNQAKCLSDSFSFLLTNTSLSLEELQKKSQQLAKEKSSISLESNKAISIFLQEWDFAFQNFIDELDSKEKTIIEKFTSMLSERFTITFSKKTWDDLPLLIQDMINKELHPVSSNLESKLCFCLKNLDNKISNLSNPVAINQNFSSFDQSTTFKSNDRLFGTIGTLILTGGSITVLTTTTVFGGVLLATGALLTAIPSYHWYKRNQRVKEECLSKGIEEIRRSINTIRTLNIPELKKLGQIHAEQKRKHTLSQIETLDKNIEEIIKSRNEKLATFPDLDLIKKDNDTLLELITIGESEVIQ